VHRLRGEQPGLVSPQLGEIFTEPKPQLKLFVGYFQGFVHLRAGEIAVFHYLGNVCVYPTGPDVVCEPEHSIFLLVGFSRVHVVHPSYC
jgi:hypothetical protein